jgi:signal transduction protein with GAF and PtsI domain
MALDTLARVMAIDCCWIQTINDRRQKKLRLAAERGFSPEIQQEVTVMDMNHSFSQQIIGMGHKIVIPDLANDGLYGLPSFRKTGFKWLVAVPLMTYRVHGILGTASRNRKLLKKDTADLIMTIAGLIAASLSKANFINHPPVPERPATAPTAITREEPGAAMKKPAAPAGFPPVEPAKRPDGAFPSHARKMEQFRKSHR